jgi:hypothetical protein
MKNMAKIAMTMASLALVACDKPQDSTASTPAASAAPNTATNAAPNTNTTGATQAKAPQPVTIADTDLVSPADYEPEAETAITSKNYKAEIATLEAEMSKE